MWTYFLANYSKFGFILLGLLLALKLVFIIAFQNYQRNVVGIVGALFKWYSVVDRELAEDGMERFSMFIQNLASIIIYLLAALLLFMSLLFK